MKSNDGLATVRLRLPYEDESSFVRGYAAMCRAGTLFIPTRRIQTVGTMVRFELMTRDGKRLMLGEGEVVEGSAPAGRSGFFVRVGRLDASSKRVFLNLKSRTKGKRPGAAATKSQAKPEKGAEKGYESRGSHSIEEAAAGTATLETLPLGLDLGTSRVRLATVEGDEPRLKRLSEDLLWMPAGVASGPGETLVVGEEILTRRLEQPGQVVLGVKRLLGRTAPSPALVHFKKTLPFSLDFTESGELVVSLARSRPTVTEVAARLLEAAASAADPRAKARKRAVLAVPAGFGDLQREALRRGAQLAGFEVARIISEPVATAIAYGVGRGLAAKRLVVIDMGAAFLDVSVITVSGDFLEVVGSGEELHLGGNDIDQRIADYLVDSIDESDKRGLSSPTVRERLLEASERVKIALDHSEREDVRLSALFRDEMTGDARDLQCSITRADLERCSRDVMDRTVAHIRKVLDEQGFEPSQIDQVLLVGGQSRMPSLRKAVAETFETTLQDEVDADGAVALGCALLARSIDAEDDPDTPEIRIKEVLASPISVGLRGGATMKVLDRGTGVPCERTIYVEGQRDDQKALDVLLFQGQAERAEQAEYIGTWTFDIPPRPKDGTLLRLRLTVDDEGRVSVEATDDATNEVRAHRRTVMRSAKEVEDRLSDLDTVIRDSAGPGDGLPAKGRKKPEKGKGFLGGLKRVLFGEPR